jgi:3-deoxy-D-manno-octulosonate 8-phosphate phosphatase (KDO 8-P phosphatase)
LGKKAAMQTETSPEALAASFVARGAQCLKPATELAAVMNTVRGLLFDWDGVFNNGNKADAGSGFSEADSMGTNMLRFGLWLRQKRMPVCALISGENNMAAKQFAQREHFDAVYAGMQDKRLAVDHVCHRHQLKTEHLACIFDDINDLGMARACGLRFLVIRSASPLLTAYITTAGLCDYVTANTGGNHAVREIAEIMLGLMAMYQRVVQARAAVDTSYSDYFSQRQSIATRFYRQESAAVVPVDGR